MEIEFKTIKNEDGYEDFESHEVLVDGKTELQQHEGICPEDVRFYRSLSSPHDCESLIKKVIDAVKNGEEVVFKYTEEIEED